MSRNQHHRSRDHFGLDADTQMATTAGVGAFPAGTLLHDVLTATSVAGLSLVLNGLGKPVLIGNQGWVEVPFDATITAARLFSDQLCNITIDIWKSTYANYPPDSGDTICASSKLTLAGAMASSNALTGWTTSIAEGDILWIHVNSNDLAQAITVALTFVRR